MSEQTTTSTAFRVEARPKGTARWRFIRFTGAGPHRDEQTARDHADLAAEQSPGYDYRVTASTVTITSTPWTPTQPEGAPS